MRARPTAPAGIATLGAAPALTGLFWALCRWEAQRARGGDRPYLDPLPGSGLVGRGLGPRPTRITWLGDSLATGLGCDHVTDTPAHLTARLLERSVEVSMLAAPGAKVADVIEVQLPKLDRTSDLVVVCVGANDVASATSRRRFAMQLHLLLADLAPLPTVALSLPDMAMPDRMAQPLRSLAGARARWFDAARARVAAAHPHVTSVDIASRPPGLSRRDGRALLCADRFHPGPDGYRLWAERIAATCHDLLQPVSAHVASSALAE
jgi:lysophospholipase L1-like esterase